MARVRVDSSGVRVMRTGPLALFRRRPLANARWSAVDRVWVRREGRAVVLTFDAPDWPGVSVADRTPGWKALVAALPERLPGADMGWRDRLAKADGAFLVWERS